LNSYPNQETFTQVVNLRIHP